MIPMMMLAIALADAPPVTPVWPDGKMPGEATKDAEKLVLNKNDAFKRITNVSKPTLTYFKAKRETPAPAVIICPGGGYSYTVVDKEGSEIAEWLNQNGISAFVLKYRSPNNRSGALMDAQRAISVVRANAKAWSIDEKQIGIMGFSAGGHLAARATTQFEKRSYSEIEAIDQVSCRPDFSILVYPAYLDDKKGKVTPDLNLKIKLPPLLIVHNDDDKTHIVGSNILHAELKKEKIDHTFQCYPTGGHGYGLHSTGDAKAWPDATLKWLKEKSIR